MKAVSEVKDMDVIKPFLSVVVIVAILVTCSFSADVVYVKYSRKLPSQFATDEYVEEIVEEFEMPYMPPYYGHTDQDVENILRNAWNLKATSRPGSVATSTSTPLYTGFGFEEAPTLTRPTTSTTSRPYPNWFGADETPLTTTTSTIRPFISWFGGGDTTTTTTSTSRPFISWFGHDDTTTTTTTSHPFVYTTKPYENVNPIYPQVIPTITADIIPPSSTPRREFSEAPEISGEESFDDVEYYDENDENGTEPTTTEAATGPTKVNFPIIPDTGDVAIPSSSTAPEITEETTTEVDNEDYDEDDDYEDEENNEDEVKNGFEVSTTPSPIVTTTSRSLLGLFNF